jgi:hypothetical protein
MRTSDPTLVQRAGYLYRHLLLLQRLFDGPDDGESSDWVPAGDEGQASAMRTGIREVLDELTDEARVLTGVPFPLREWRPGDGPDDERWRALTEVERREVLAMVSGYENLITWAEEQIAQRIGPQDRAEPAEARPSRKPLRGAADLSEYLNAERARLARFRRDMSFLDRRRITEPA